MSIRGMSPPLPFVPPLPSDKQIRQMDNILNRLSRLAVEANRLGVRLMIDAGSAADPSLCAHPLGILSSSTLFFFRV